jgi:hypothetical protein
MDHPQGLGPVDSSARPEFVTMPLDRRHFLVLLGGAAAYTALAPQLGWAARRDRRPTSPPWTLPDVMPPATLDAARALIGAAILAPSYWNAQPWRFEVDGTELRLTLDPSRTLPSCDPDQRFTLMSLGAALENLLVASRAWGQQPSVRYLPWGSSARAGAPRVVASITWAPGEAHRDRALFAAIPLRRSNPRPYEGRGITMQERAQLQAQVPDELRLHWLDDRSQIRTVAGVVHDAIRSRTVDAKAQVERYRWLRLSDSDERRSGDGVTPERMSLFGPLGWLVARALHPRSRAYAWGAGSLAHETADATRHSGALALLTAPKRQDATFLLAGQAYERVALKAAELGLAQQPLAGPIESEAHRAPLSRRFGAAAGEEPLLLVRFGHARAPEPTARRAVALVSTYHAS